MSNATFFKTMRTLLNSEVENARGSDLLTVKNLAKQGGDVSGVIGDVYKIATEDRNDSIRADAVIVLWMDVCS